MSLADVPYNTPVRVASVRLQGALSYRLLEMGFIRGAEVEVLRRAPLGDPLQVRVGDFDISLRGTEARLIDVDGH